MSFQKSTLVLLFLVLAMSAFPIFAQDSEPVVIDEVVAQVNDSVITLSRVKRETENAINAFAQNGMSREEATRKVNQAEVIAGLIDEELVTQKGKESGVDGQIESEVNQRFLAIMKEQKLKTLDSLYEEMKRNNLDPEEIRAGMRRQLMQSAVLQAEVDRKIFYGITSKEIKEFYEAHKDKFKKPETVAMSEIFLSLAGRNEPEVRAKAAQLVAEARKGTDFATLAVQNSERPDVATSKGTVGKFAVNELDEKYQKAIKDLKAGGITEPVESDEGLSILRVDERTAASSDAEFDENRVKMAILGERKPAAYKKYLNDLRQDAYIKIAANYRDSVTAVLYRENKVAEKDQKKNEK